MQPPGKFAGGYCPKQKETHFGQALRGCLEDVEIHHTSVRLRKRRYCGVVNGECYKFGDVFLPH